MKRFLPVLWLASMALAGVLGYLYASRPPAYVGNPESPAAEAKIEALFTHAASTGAWTDDEANAFRALVPSLNPEAELRVRNKLMSKLARKELVLKTSGVPF